MLGGDIDEFIVPTSHRAEGRELEVRARRGEIVRAEVERQTKDGRRIPVRLSAAAVKAAGEGALVVLYEDISERKAAEEAMRAARDLAERVARARSAFLANMSHEIRTPMNAVLGFVELVLDTDLAPEQRRALELVRSSSEALLTILNDILDYSKIEAEHLELERIPVLLAKNRNEIPHPFPTEQQLASALKEELLVEHAARDERRNHLPVRREHPVGCVLLAAGGTERVEVFERSRLERAGEPSARLAKPRLAPHVVQLENQFHIIERRFRCRLLH